MAEHDLVIANGRIVDGCGNPWFRGDVGIRGRRVAAVGPPGSLRGRRVIDAADRYVTPGFVDPHTHSDLSILAYPLAQSAVHQGVTTHVTGNCGMGPAPVVERFRDDLRREWDYYWRADVDWSWRSFASYLRTIEARGAAINIAPLVGHGALRIGAMGYAERAATPKELDDDAPAAGRRHARRRPRALDRSRLPAGVLRRHRRDRRLVRGGGRVPRHLHVAYPRRARDDPRGGRRGDRHRARHRGAGRGVAQRAQVGCRGGGQGQPRAGRSGAS